MPFWLVCLFMVYNVTFNNISDTGGPGENHRPVASHWQTLSHNVESSTPRHERKKIFTLTLRQPYGVTNTPQRRYDKKEDTPCFALVSVTQLVPYCLEFWVNTLDEYRCFYSEHC
jgi:hypothetical protein